MTTPMKSPVVRRIRPTIWDGLVVLLVVAFAATVAWNTMPRGESDALVAHITLDGVEVDTIVLATATDETVTMTVDCPYPLTVEYTSAAIRVAHGDCPSGDCMRSGWIDSPGAQIVCLPNRLIISLTGESDSEPAFDAMTS